MNNKKDNQQLPISSTALMGASPKHEMLAELFIIQSAANQRSRLATELQFLLMKYVFEHPSFRRYKWFCDSLNPPSIKAALLSWLDKTNVDRTEQHLTHCTHFMTQG